MSKNNTISLSSRTLTSYMDFLDVSNSETFRAFMDLIRDFDLELCNASDDDAFRALTR
jgi:hypothetical protein